VQAIVGTVVVFATMLVLYRTGAVKVTPRLTKWIIGATMGALALVVFNLVLSLFQYSRTMEAEADAQQRARCRDSCDARQG